VPEDGEAVRFKNLELTAEDVQERRIGTVHIQLIPEEQLPESAERNGSTVDAPPA
jgi:hypothetical protein